jgi:hypothetical protein
MTLQTFVISEKLRLFWRTYLFEQNNAYVIEKSYVMGKKIMYKFWKNRLRIRYVSREGN